MNKDTAIEVKIEAENFTKSSEYFEVKYLESNLCYVKATKEGWIALDVNIAVAGRYKTEINVAQNNNEDVVKCWIEDYYDNKDNRQYNLTSTILLEKASSQFITLGKDGSPLNSGLHRIKIHFDKGIKIDWVKFSLLKEHDITPLTLMQKTNGKDWKVVWSDEFNAVEIDTTKWA